MFWSQIIFKGDSYPPAAVSTWLTSWQTLVSPCNFSDISNAAHLRSEKRVKSKYKVLEEVFDLIRLKVRYMRKICDQKKDI